MSLNYTVRKMQTAMRYCVSSLRFAKDQEVLIILYWYMYWKDGSHTTSMKATQEQLTKL